MVTAVAADLRTVFRVNPPDSGAVFPEQVSTFLQYLRVEVVVHIDVLVLQAKLTLIEGDAGQAFKLLERARELAEQKVLVHLVGKVEEQQEELKQELKQWKQLLDRNAPLQELVKLADLARITGVKSIRARLYHDAGLDTFDKIALLDATMLREICIRFVKATSFPGVPPTLKEAAYTVTSAKTLPRIVEW